MTSDNSTSTRAGSRIVVFLVLSAAMTMAEYPSSTLGGDTLVSVGSPTDKFPANKQNEPAIAVDANHPNIVVAGANDNIDSASRPVCLCPVFGPGVSGVYFSFDSGNSWTQPTYTGLTARHCTEAAACEAEMGPIGTLPWYSENGLATGGDPALAFGPVPGADGSFSWANGSRLYYATLAFYLGGSKGFSANNGDLELAVSRTDDVAAAAASDKGAWLPPVIVSKLSPNALNDKEQIWADNAESSPNFGYVYVCWVSIRSNSEGPATGAPLMVATSTDGGDTWRRSQVTPAHANAEQGHSTGCTIRTDSHGVVYVFAYQWVAYGSPGAGQQLMIKSFDGGKSWTKPVSLFDAVASCWEFDARQSRCVSDGLAGARSDLPPAPSVDIANGAPTGADATNIIVTTFVDAVDGLNHEHVVVRHSTDGGATWSAPVNVERPGHRGLYSAVGLSPDGTDVYLVYNALTTPFRDNTFDPRGLVGVVLHADVGPSGPGAFSELHRGDQGDPRASSTNGLTSEFLGDYVYAIGTRTYGAAVWNDVRDGAVCDPINVWRQSLREDAVPIPRPDRATECLVTFGNTDIFGGSYADPS